MSRLRLGVERDIRAFGKEIAKGPLRSSQRRSSPWGGGVRPRETYRGHRRNKHFGRLPMGNSTPLERLARKRMSA